MVGYYEREQLESARTVFAQDDLVEMGRHGNPIRTNEPGRLNRITGVIEEQRFALKNACVDFVEMTPNRADNFCCGGGGGQLSMGEYRDRRVDAGQIKADQIRGTGAKIVATPCHNCIDQLMDL